MAIPVGVDSGTVTGTLINAQGDPVQGQIFFTPEYVANVSDQTVILPAPVAVTLDDSGHFSEVLMAGGNPQGWTYRIASSFSNSVNIPILHFELDPGAELDISGTVNDLINNMPDPGNPGTPTNPSDVTWSNLPGKPTPMPLDEAEAGTADTERTITAAAIKAAIDALAPAGGEGSQGPKGDQGDPGESAYQIAVDNGFSGSESDWLASLVGPAGTDGSDGAEGPAGPPNSLSIGTVATGAAGSSAAATITGTSPAQTLNLTIPQGIKGDKGDQGDQGPQGDPGTTTWAGITDKPAVIASGSTEAAARNSIGAGTSNLVIGTTSGTAADAAVTQAALDTKADASSLATVATSGSYADLSNKPTIPAAQVQSDWNATSGVAAIANKPDLSDILRGVGVANVVRITQAAYEALDPPDEETFYILEG